QSSMKLGEAMYRASQESAGAGPAGDAGDAGGAQAGTKDDGVVDADFEEVRDDDDRRKSAS
ncbi:MAG: hypothetical protein FJX53_12425, partial [Alphaproteobacteria bacterium]|nr:hypothetical protein [Alphaproteobacteria bacterium]